MNLNFDNVWNELIKNWGATPRYIAVPYFTCDKNLNFNQNDILIVNASIGAIKLGQTDAKALRRVYKSGAQIYSCENLHAKVYVLGTTVFVGSANSSISSRNNLIECLASSNNPHSVSEAISFILALRKQSERINDDFLKSIEKIEIAKKAPPPLPLEDRISLHHPRCWLLSLYDIEYPGNKEKIINENLELQNNFDRDNEIVDWFWWPLKHNSKFIKEATSGDLFIDIYRSDKKSTDTNNIIVYRHARICKITQEDKIGGKIYHAAWPDDCEKTTLRWEEFCDICKRAGWNVKLSLNSCRQIPDNISRAIHTLWPS